MVGVVFVGVANQPRWGSCVNELESVDVAVTPVEKFREFLATKGQRFTQERQIIVDEVYSSHEHFEADDLVNRLTLRKDDSRVSRSTVYRALNLLEEAGLLRKVARPQGREVFEHDYGYPQHDHLLCQKCGSLTEFPNETISSILDQIAEQHGFRLSGHRLVVYGTCTECSRPARRRHSKLDLL